MVGPKAMGFSLLSRGVGQREGEKMEVKLESADYYNWINDPSRVFLPPIHISKLETPRRVEPVSLKKTFTTRKGALLLFSEDFAVKEEDEKGKDEKAADSEPLKVEDFAKCVLSYGDRSSPELGGEHVYLKFVHHRRDKLRAVRPGFSAKRYIASWSKTADDNFIAKLTTAGAILDSTLYESNLFLPHLKHRVGTDLSHYPAPYRLMRDMLMSPGEVSGYTFLWQPHDSSREMTSDENGVMYPSGRSPSLSQGSIKVMRQDTKGEMHEVEYSDLDENTKESVLTELLLKSAISHALQKTEEAMEKAMSGSRPNSVVQELAEAFAIDAPPNTASPKSESPAKSPDKLDLRKDSIKIPAGHSPDAGMFVVTSRRPSHESRTSRSDSPKSKKTSSSPTKGNESPTTVRSHRTTKSDSTKKSDSDRLGADSPGKKSTSSKSSGLSVPRVVIKPHLNLGGIPKAEEPRAPSTHSRSGSTPSSTRGSPSKQPKRQSPTMQPGQPGSPTVAAKTPKVTMIGGPFGIAEEEEDGFEEAPRGPVFVKPTAGKKVTSNKPRGPGLSRQASQPGGMGLVKFDMKEAVETMLSEPPKPDEGILKQAQQAAKQETRQQEMVMEDMGTKARAPFARKIRGGALTSGGTVQGNVQDMKAQQGSLFPTLDEAPKSEYKPKLQKRATASTTFPPIEENQKVTRQPGILMEVAEPAPPTMTAGEARIRRLQSEADERERKTSHEEKSEGGHPASLARGDSTLQSVTEDDVMSVKKPKRKRIERPSSTTVFEEATGRVKHFTSRISMDDSEADLIEARTRRQKLRKILREQSAFIPDHIRKLQERPVRTMSAGDARPLSGSRGPGARQDKPITLADLALPPGLDKVIKLMQDEEERNPNAFSNKRRALVNRQGVPQRSSSRADLLKKGMDGSLLMAPDGDVIKIGQTIQPDISDPSTWKHLTKEQLIEKLRKHAAEIAARVLKGGGGKDLAADARLAADIWTENYTERSKTFIEGLEKSETESSITDSVQQTLQAQMLGQLLANFKNLEDIAEFKDVLLQTLGNIVSSLTGMNIVLPADAEISEELLRALANQDLDPEDIEVYVDPITGKTYVRLRKKGQKPTPMVERKLGDVVIPAGVDIDDELAAMLAMGQYNEDDIEFVFDEKTGRRVARLKQGAVKKKPKIGGVEIPDDAVLSDDIMKALASGDLCADDLELVWDEKLGRHVVRVKSAAKNKVRTIGGVIIPKDAVIDDALAAALALGEYDADDIEYVFDEKTGKMVVRLKEGAKKKPKNIGGIEIPADAELDEEVLALLKSGNINPDDLEVFFDEATGKTIVRLKKKAQPRVLGEVEIPADVEIDAELAAMLAMGQYSADDIEFVIDDKTGKRVARLKKNAVKKPPTIAELHSPQKGGVKLPDDAYIPEDILAALANSTLTADDLEVVWDEKLGRHVVRVKSAARRKKVRQLGDVFIPRDAVIDDALAAALALGEYSADDLEYIYDEKTGKTIVRLKAGAKKKPRKIGGVDIPADAEISAELLAALQAGDLTADDMELVWDEATGKMVVRLKSSYKRRMEAEERRRLNLRPLSGEKERPHFVFGKKPDDELTSLYGPYDPSKKVQYGIPEVQISGQVPEMSSPIPPPPDFPSAPAPTALSDASVLVRTPKVKDATPQKQPAVKAPKKLKPKTESKKEPQAPKVKEGKGKKPKGKSKEPPSKKAKTTDDEEEEFVPRKIKPKVLKRERSGEESSDFERVPTEPETEIGKRKIKLRTDSGRSYYTEVDEDEYELEHLERETTKDSIVEIRIDSARELSVVLKDVEPEPAKPESPIFDDIEEQQQTGPFSRWLEKDEFGRPRLLSKAKAERRRREIEKKRTERELKKKQDKEDAEAAEKLQRELEEEMERKMEEARLKREQEEAERIARIEREAELEEQRHQAAERAKKLREQQKEKMEMMRKQREEEERQRREQQRLREEAEAERLRREQSMLERMGREEREEFLRKQREEQQERARQEAAEKRRQMEEARRQMEEARRLAEEMMRRQKDMEQRLTFNRGLWAESTGLDHSHDVSRAFVWSYFELLQWLGLDIPSN